MNKNIKKIISFLMCVSMILTCFGVIPKQVSAKDDLEQWNFLGDNKKLSWSTNSGEKEPQEIVLSKSVTVTKLRLKVPEVYKWKYFRIYEIEAFNKNGKNMCTNGMTRGTVSLGGGFKENVTGSAARFLIDGSIGGTSYYQYSPSTTEMSEGYIEISFSKPVEVSSVKIWCDWCHDGKGNGAAPKVWEIYGNDTFLFYDDFTEDLYKWSESDGFSIMNKAAVPNANESVIMYSGESTEKNYRVEADIIGTSGIMGIVTHYSDNNDAYYVAIDKNNNCIRLFKNRELLKEKKWTLGSNITLAVNVSSSRISVWLDETKMLDYDLQTEVIAGKWGIFSEKSVGAFEGVRVFKHHEMNDLPGDFSYDEIRITPEYDCNKADFYVSTSGNDINSGTYDSPFATIERAKDAINNDLKSNSNKNYVVAVRGGRYEVSDTLNFDTGDGGNGKYRVTYVAYTNETPIISGKNLDNKNIVTVNGNGQNTICNLDFVGLRFENNGGNAVVLENASSIGIYQCEFEDINGNAVIMNQGSSGCAIVDNCFINIDTYAIKIGNGVVDEEENYPRGIYVAENYFDNCGVLSNVETIKTELCNHITIIGNTIKKSSVVGIVVGVDEASDTKISHHNMIKQNIVNKISVNESEYKCAAKDNVQSISLSESGKAGCNVGKSGDVNDDSRVDILDIVRLKVRLSDNQIKISRINSDINNDYTVSESDSDALRRIIAKRNHVPAIPDIPVTFISQKVDTPKFRDNYLRKSDVKITTNGNSDSLDGTVSGNTYTYDSKGTLEKPQEFIYQWNEEVSVNMLRIYANYASSQAPSHLQIYVRNNGYWYKAQNCKLLWDDNATDYYEYVDITVEAENITGLKVVVEEANLDWDHFIITEMELSYVESDKEGYRLIFEDNFDSDLGEQWLTKYLPHATSYNSDTTYTMDNGNLVLRLDKDMSNYADYTSMKASSIQTYEKNLLHPGAVTENVTDVEKYESFTCKYGYFEMRAKLPNCGGGGHMAWWLVGTQDDANDDGTGSLETGEIDILETTFLRTNTFAPKVHTWTDTNLNEYENEVTLKGDFVNEYHTYAMDWTPSGITFYVDGEIVGNTTQSPDYRMAMLISMYTDGAGWSGAANGVWPKECYIDYVRVYQKTQGYKIQ